MTIDRQEALQAISKDGTQVSVDPHAVEQTLDQTKKDTLEAIDEREKGDILKMRRLWSKSLLASIMFIVLFDSAIILGLGLHLISFEAEYLVPAFIIENLIKVFGLAYIVVNFLFPNDEV